MKNEKYRNTKNLNTERRKFCFTNNIYKMLSHINPYGKKY